MSRPARASAPRHRAPPADLTPEQLFVFARATAARDEDNGGVAVVVAAPRR